MEAGAVGMVRGNGPGWLGYAFLLFTGVTFGTLEVFSKLMPHVAPMQLNFLRFLIGGLVILPFGIIELRRRKTEVLARDLLTIALLGTLLVAVSMSLLQFSVTKVPASLVAFIFSANPMIIALLASFILAERPKPHTILFILLGMVGMAFIIRPFGTGFDPDVLYPLLSVTLFGLYIVLARRLSRRMGSLFVTSSAILSGVAVLGVYATASGVSLLGGLTAKDMGYLAYLGVIVSGLAYVSYFKGMDLTSTNTGSVVFFLKAMTAAVLSSSLLDEKLELPVIIGAIFIAAGIAVMVYGGVRDTMQARIDK